MYVVTWPETHPSGGIITETHIDDEYSGSLNTITPYQVIILGRVNRITLQSLNTNGTPLSLDLIDQRNRTLFGIVHPIPVDLANNTLTFTTYEGFPPIIEYDTNLTLRLARISSNLTFTLHILAQEIELGPLVSYYYPFPAIIILFVYGLSLIIGGFVNLDRIIRALDENW